MTYKANILLIFPECSTKIFGGNENPATTKEKTISPPLGILYLGAELSQAGYNVEACDYNAEDFSAEHLSRIIENVDLVGLSLLSFNLNHADHCIAIINRLRPELPIIVGGPDCILHPRSIPGTRLTFCHEAEAVIIQIVEKVLNNGDLSELPGIVYADDSGRECHGLPFQQPNDLDSIRFPKRELLRNNKGYAVIGKKRSRKVTAMITSRGCPKQCAFCAHGAIVNRVFRQRSSRNVLDEIKQIADQGYEVLGIVDDNFTANKTRAAEIMNGIIDMKLDLCIIVQGRVDAADKVLYSLMKKAGVVFIAFGMESGCQEVLDFYKKETTVEQGRNAVILADEVGLYTGGIFMLGAPFETKDHFERTYKFATSIPLDVTTFWVLDYTYGSALWENAVARGLINSDEYNVPAGKQRGTSDYFTEEIETVAKSFFFRFYRRPSYWIRQFVKLVRIREKYFFYVLIAGVYWLVEKKLSFLGSWSSKKQRR
jgi:anaerobic magnesium-protoporphyrin IX monomethyl ester cyclase